jgi:hypothetical protein
MAYLEKVAPRSRPDYERTILLITDIVTRKGDRIGDRHIRAITPVSADKIYDIICNGPRGPRLRQGEKAVALCRRAWRVVHRLHPGQFDRDVPNPWEGVTKRRRTKGTKGAATREQVYEFAWGCIERGQPEAAAAAVICFEWLQRPENVLAGYLRWTDYRSKEWPNAIKIEHHKTGAVVWHPLEERTSATCRCSWLRSRSSPAAIIPPFGGSSPPAPASNLPPSNCCATLSARKRATRRP